MASPPLLNSLQARGCTWPFLEGVAGKKSTRKLKSPPKWIKTGISACFEVAQRGLKLSCKSYTNKLRNTPYVNERSFSTAAIIQASHSEEGFALKFEINASKIFTRGVLNDCSTAAKLSKRWLWPSHFHLNGLAQSHLLSAFLQPDRLTKNQWAEENRKASL